MRIGKPVKRSSRSAAWKKAGVSVGVGSLRHNQKSHPQHVSTETIIGQVSPDLIATIFAPRLKELALQALERYADQVLRYEDALLLAAAAASDQPKAHETAEVEIDANGETMATTTRDSVSMELPEPPVEPLFHSQSCIDRLDAMFTETSEHFMASSSDGWKVHVNAARFERSLDEKYGIFRPFVTDHPEIEQLIRSIQRKYAMGYFMPTRKPPIPRATAVILLFMMQRGKLPWQVMLLATLFFLVGLQPWALVASIALVQALRHGRQRKAIGRMSRRIMASTPYYSQTPQVDNGRLSSNDESENKRKHALLLQPVGVPLEQALPTLDTADYDAILLGHGPGTLFAGALLARAGRKVLVLSSRHDASGCLTFLNAPSPSKDGDGPNIANLHFDVENSNVPKVSRQQDLLAPALATTTDCQGGIRFAKIGSAADDYAFEILSVPGMGTDGQAHDHCVPFILKGGSSGIASLMEDAAMYLGDNWPESDTDLGDSRTGQFFAACETMNAHASLFYISKILHESVNTLRSNTSYHDATLRNCTTLLNSCFPLNAHLRSLMAAIGMKGENLPPHSTCMAALITNVCATLNTEGMHYPVGGPRALCHALAHVIEQNGGLVVSGAPVHELLFDTTIPTKVKQYLDAPTATATTTTANDPAPPFCVGVKVGTSSGESVSVRFATERYKSKVIPPYSPMFISMANAQAPPCPVVISMEGFIQTFIRWLPDDIRSTYKVPRGVPALSERRPVVHFLVALRGSAADLSITGADYYRLPGAAVARDEVDPETGDVNYGTIGWSDEDHSEPDDTNVESSTNNTGSEAVQDDEASKANNEARRKKRRHAKFETGQSWLRISFPSAKDPSFQARHGNVSTCVVSIEADDDFVALFDTKPRLFVVKKRTASTGGDIQRLTERIRKDLLDIYPQLEGKILHSELCGPFQTGLSHNPERYAAKGIRADTPYPGLYAGGSDLTVGDSFSGATVGAWLVANAVCGYSAVDHLFLEKNISTDLKQFMVIPTTLQDGDDVAVPFTPTEPELQAEAESNE